jgi:glycosyltransferase involved in cell wall biosynthesis
VSRATYNPLVTIAVPTFNRAELVKGCITAALQQSYAHFELLVSDNASTDETPEVLNSFSDQRLRIVRQQTNVGLLANLNVLLERARGEFIVFVPDDDRIAPHMLERCMTLAEREPEISVVVTLCNVHFVAEGRTWQAPGNQRLGTGVWDGADILHEFLKDRISAAMCSVMYRTERLRAGGGFPLNFPYAADVVTWAPLLLDGKAGLVNEPCASLAQHDATQTNNLAIETRIDDGRKTIDVIATTADSTVKDVRKLRQIKSEARRYFARRTVAMLTQYRRQGGKFAEVLPLMRRFCRDFARIAMSDTAQLARSLVIIALPARVTQWIRDAVRSRKNPRGRSRAV